MWQTEREIVEISCLTIHKTQLNAQNGANGEISQNAMALIANMPNRKRNSRNFPFGNTLNVKLLHQMEPTAKFHQWLILIMLLKIDLIDS